MRDDMRNQILDIPVNRKVIFNALSYLMVFLIGFLAQMQTVVHPTNDVSVTSTQVDAAHVADSASSPREYGNGWHSIEVFYGKTEALEEKYPQKEWYSQVKQDLIVSRLFRSKTNGYFLDLAANDAIKISNTYALEKKFNWTGLCMEPNPSYWFNLAHRDCQVVGAVVGELRNDAVVFQTTSNGAFGGIVGAEFDRNRPNQGGEVRYTVPLSEILQRFQAPPVMDYLSLDVEGAETLIMRHFPFHEYSFNVMTVERPKDDLKALFEENGYEYVGTISKFGETLWVRKAYRDSLNIASVEEFFIE
jgi:Methyltransferase FkbM domain